MYWNKKKISWLPSNTADHTIFMKILINRINSGDRVTLRSLINELLWKSFPFIDKHTRKKMINRISYHLPYTQKKRINLFADILL